MQIIESEKQKMQVLFDRAVGKMLKQGHPGKGSQGCRYYIKDHWYSRAIRCVVGQLMSRRGAKSCSNTTLSLIANFSVRKAVADNNRDLYLNADKDADIWQMLQQLQVAHDLASKEMAFYAHFLSNAERVALKFGLIMQPIWFR